MTEGRNFAEAGMRSFQEGLGMLSYGNAGERSRDSIERACSQGWMYEMDPSGAARRAGQYRALAMRLAQELPDDAATANAVLDHARELARQLREGFNSSSSQGQCGPLSEGLRQLSREEGPSSR